MAGAMEHDTLNQRNQVQLTRAAPRVGTRLVVFHRTRVGAALFLKGWCSMVDREEWERMTVSEALTTTAKQLKELVDWARTRLERAASLVALATEPRRPDGQMDFAVRRAEALSMVEALCESIGSGLKEDPEPAPGITFLVGRAFDANMDATTREDADRWASEKLEHMTVGELAQAFKVEDAATA
jgi:hypothetical protein